MIYIQSLGRKKEICSRNKKKKFFYAFCATTSCGTICIATLAFDSLVS